MTLKRIFHIIIFFSIFGSSVTFAQQSTIDSLQNIFFANMQKEGEVENNLKILEELYNITHESDLMQATIFIAQAQALVDSNSVESTMWEERLGNIYFDQNKLHVAMKSYSKVKEFYKKDGTQSQIAYSIYNFGKVYSALGVTSIAIDKFNEAYKIFSEIKDTTGIITVKNKMSEVYFLDYEGDTAYQILYKNIPFCKNQEPEIKAETYFTIAKLYQNELEQDSALKYYSKAYTEYEKAGNQFKIADVFLAKGETNIEKEDYVEAKNNLENALKIYEKRGANHKISECYNKLGENYFLNGKLSYALKSFNKALEIAGINSLSLQKQFAYEYISAIYRQQGKPEKALDFITLYNIEKDFFYEQNTKEGFAQVIVLSQNEEKQKEIALLEEADKLKSKQLRSNRQLAYIAILLIIVFIAFTMYFFYTSKKQKKQNSLLQKQYDKINFQKKEIESQAKILEKATRSILKQKDQLLKKTTKITSSIKYASRIQKAMLPTKSVLGKYFDDYFVFYRPKESVSGDFFWLSEVADNKRPSLFQSKIPDNEKKIVFSVIDCTGHGVPGAFMSMLGDAYLNQIIGVQKIQEPEEILYELHKVIRHTLQQHETDNNDGMDMSICVVDRKEQTLKFAGAKNPIVYIQNEEMYRINGDLASIGGLQKEKERFFTGHTIDVSVPTCVYMYSDGFQDQFGGKYGRKFMAKPFRQMLYDNHKFPFVKQKENITKIFKGWKGKNYSQMDDVTLVGFKI